jgi:hypothetical protein
LTGPAAQADRAAAEVEPALDGSQVPTEQCSTREFEEGFIE